MSYKRQELLTLREHLSSVMLISLVFCVVLLCVFMFWGRCCVVRFEFRIKTMFGSSWSPTVCGRQTIGDKDEPNIVLMFVSNVLFTLFVSSCVSYVTSYSLIVHFWLPLLYSLTLINTNMCLLLFSYCLSIFLYFKLLWIWSFINNHVMQWRYF